jgi:hypothetical protein
MKTSTTITRTHKTRAYRRRKMIEQRLMGFGLIAAGVLACVLEPQEGGAALIMIGGLGLWMMISRKQLIY